MIDFGLARTSQDSILSVGQEFAEAIQNASSSINFKCAEEFFELVFALEMHPLLAKKLTDPNRSVADRQTLAKKVLKALKPEKLTVSIVSKLVENKWSRPRDLQVAVGKFGFTSCIISVQAQEVEGKGTRKISRLEQTEQELFELVVKLKDLSKVDPDIVRLRELLSTSSQPLDGRIEVVDQLFGNKSRIGTKLDPVTILFAKYATAMPDGGKYLGSLQKVAEKIAETRSLQIVNAVVAVPPTAKQVKRLEKLCEKKYKKDIQLNIVVDKTILGGLKISVEDEVFDLTLLNAFNKFRSDFEVEFKA